MAITSKAKTGFPSRLDDLYRRGSRLIEESVEHGVTSMRAHVEVDTIVGFSCLDVALDLKARYKDVCDVQIAGAFDCSLLPFPPSAKYVVFAQEALFERPSDIEPGENYAILCQAMRREGVSVIGSAPYVEPTFQQAKKNIQLIFQAVMGSQEAFPRHIDFHLDYNLNPTAEPLIYEVIAQARMYNSRYNLDCASEYGKDIEQNLNPTPRLCCDNKNPIGPSITIGHATRLQLLLPSDWHKLRAAIGDLPITIVGLPQSDMYIQGRDHQDSPLGPPRSTLRVPLIKEAYGIKVAMAVNNVDNAFTPQGTLDPLNLVTFGVAIFQAATPKEIRSLIVGFLLRT